jgi:hypothetical protein
MTTAILTVSLQHGTVLCPLQGCQSSAVYRDTPGNRSKVQRHARNVHNIHLSTVTDSGPKRTCTPRCGALCFPRNERAVNSLPHPCRRIVLKGGCRCYEHNQLHLNDALLEGGHESSPRSPVYATSSIRNAGNGVFARKCYRPGDVITIFDGDMLDQGQPVSCADKDWTLLLRGHLVRGYQIPVSKRGLGSFVNGSDKRHKSNVRFRWFENHSLVALECTRFIRSKQELFVAYGSGYWKRWQKDHPSMNVPQLTQLELLYRMCKAAGRGT